MSKPSVTVNQYVQGHGEPESPSAAKRRKSAAHGVSRGCRKETSEPRRGERRVLAHTQNSASWFSRGGLLSVVISAVLLCATLPARAQSPNAPLPPGEAKEKAGAACLTCHEARIIVQQRLSKAAWTKELDKMIKWGAEVDANDHDALIDYFTANFGPDQPVYAAPKSQAESASKSKSKH